MLFLLLEIAISSLNLPDIKYLLTSLDIRNFPFSLTALFSGIIIVVLDNLLVFKILKCHLIVASKYKLWHEFRNKSEFIFLFKFGLLFAFLLVLSLNLKLLSLKRFDYSLNDVFKYKEKELTLIILGINKC